MFNKCFTVDQIFPVFKMLPKRIFKFNALILSGILGCGFFYFILQTKYIQTETSPNSFTDPDLQKLIENHSAATGIEFSGVKIRTFKNVPSSKEPTVKRILGTTNASQCAKWGVMTTISGPSESVRRFLYKSDWCVVVVADLDKPKDFVIETTLGSNIIFLSSEDQRNFANQFVDGLPWRSFGRKNVGYLFAIARGAQVIWDFDDDNYLKFWLDGAAVDKSLDINSFVTKNDSIEVSDPVLQNEPIVFNPYTKLGCPVPTCWPRGFPLNQIQNADTWNVSFRSAMAPLASFGVLQSLADIQPDVDAVFRLTQKTPFIFEKPTEIVDYDKTRPIVRIPNTVITPYNAQATLHFYPAFWALYLPISVSGRVSDIWRSFVAQAFFKHLGLSLGFLPRPIVVQDRNPHSYDADFMAELPLYVQAKALTSHIFQNYINNTEQNFVKNFTESIEQLWIDLFERGFVESDDVYLVKLWIKALTQIGYQFPGNGKDQNEKSVSSQHLKLLQGGKTLKDISDEFTKNLYQNSTYLNTSCSNNSADSQPSLVFGNSDLHDGPRADIPSVLSHLGQEAVVMGIKRSWSPYPDVFQMTGVKIYERLSRTINNYQTHSQALTVAEVEENTKFYRSDTEVQRIDAFVCSFPASMCQMWLSANKSVVFLPAHRYNLGRCTSDDWHKLDDDIRKMSSDASGRHTIAAMSRYDTEYLRYYTGIEPLALTSFSGYYTNGNPYAPSKDEILIMGGNINIKELVETLKPDFNAVLVHDLYKFYSLQNLVSHRAVIFLPYSVMSYKHTELYSLSIPLFVPSPKFFVAIKGLGADRTSTSWPYCSKDPELERKMRPSLEAGYSSHPYSPNAEWVDDPEAEMYWLQMSDFYDWPHTQLFDSFQDLKVKLNRADFKSIHLDMMSENKIRGMQLISRWCSVIERMKRIKT